MSKKEIKHEINRVLDQFSDRALQDILSFLKGIEARHSNSLLSGDNFKKILSEDKTLLEKLAK